MKAIILTSILFLLLSSIALADISAFYRREKTWVGYKTYTIDFPTLACSEYGYNNGNLPQDLTLLGVPTGAILLGNSYGEIRKEGNLLVREEAIELTRASYSPNSISIDLPRSTVSGDGCKGTFYLVFKSGSDIILPVEPIQNETINETTTTTLATTTTTITAIAKEECNFFCEAGRQFKLIIDGIVNFFSNILKR